MSRLMECLKENVGDTGGLQDFSSIACYFVYGHAQQGRQPQEKKIDSDPDYEPDDVEEADTEYEIVIAKEENTQRAVVGSTMAQQKKGIQKVLQELERIMYLISDVLASSSRSKRKRFEAGKFEFSNDDLNARLAVQQKEIEHFRMKHQEELEAVMKAHEAKNLAFEKSLQDMDSILAYFLRMTAQSSQHNYRPAPPS